ncbi:MAG TPA: NADH-quinone oxidoreductase subunit C [Gammaproteobacteria bacterium]|nr:NADH-quinone oxidoreductase subunit C [Gammaproteobacteria bacterium]
MSNVVETLVAKLEKRFGEAISVSAAYGEVTAEIAAKDVIPVCTALRDEPEFAFAQLSDLCAVDYLAFGEAEWQTHDATGSGFSRGVERHPITADASENDRRFAVVYHLLSIDHNARLRLKVYLHGEQPIIDTVVPIWNVADWFEREAFDLFGIMFAGHPDLRRLLTDYGFIGHPFRKDFPLIGNVEMRYDIEKGRVIYEPVSITPRTLVPKVIRDDALDPPVNRERGEHHG